MGLTTSSVQVAPDVAERNLLNRETMFAAHLYARTKVHPSTHWNQIAIAARYFDGLQASTTELNKVEGLDASSTELNKLSGVTASSTQIQKLANVASTGNLITMQHIPWKSSINQTSTAIVASSTDLRLMIMSSGMLNGQSSLYISATRLGFATIIAVQTQLQSTHSKWVTANVRRPSVLVPSIMRTSSTVRIIQYASSVGATAQSTHVIGASSLGLLRESSGACHLQVFAYGY